MRSIHHNDTAVSRNIISRGFFPDRRTAMLLRRLAIVLIRPFSLQHRLSSFTRCRRLRSLQPVTNYSRRDRAPWQERVDRDAYRDDSGGFLCAGSPAWRRHIGERLAMDILYEVSARPPLPCRLFAAKRKFADSVCLLEQHSRRLHLHVRSRDSLAPRIRQASTPVEGILEDRLCWQRLHSRSMHSYGL